MELEDKVPTKIISGAMRNLYCDIQSGDGVANAACLQAAVRLDELQAILDKVKNYLKAMEDSWS